MSDKIIEEKDLDEVNGGFGGNTDFLNTFHVCGNGKTGELLSIGFGNGGKPRFKCKACGKEGFISYQPGTRKLCNLN